MPRSRVIVEDGTPRFQTGPLNDVPLRRINAEALLVTRDNGRGVRVPIPGSLGNLFSDPDRLTLWKASQRKDATVWYGRSGGWCGVIVVKNGRAIAARRSDYGSKCRYERVKTARLDAFMAIHLKDMVASAEGDHHYMTSTDSW